MIFKGDFKKLFQVSIFSIKIHLCLIQSIFDTRTIKISSCCFFVYLNLLKGKKLRWKLLIFINMLKTVDLEQITSAFYAINCRVSNMRKKCLFILLCNIFKYISLFSNSSLLYCWLSLSTMYNTNKLKINIFKLPRKMHIVFFWTKNRK